MNQQLSIGSSELLPLARLACALAAPLTAFLAFWPTGGFAAYSPADELVGLRKAAASEAFVAVQANLDIDVPLFSSGPPSDAIKAKVRLLEEGLKAELAGVILPSAIWVNGAGQVGIYVSQAGLERLERSSVARSFGRDRTREMRRTVIGTAEALAAVEAQLQLRGYADIQVLDNLEWLEFDLPRVGGSGHRATAAWNAEAARTRPAFIQEVAQHGAAYFPPSGAGAVSASQAEDPVLRFRVDWNAYRFLIEHGRVRSMSLLPRAGEGGSVGMPTIPVRPAVLDPEALAEAEAAGVASVTIDLHRVFGYTPLKSRVSLRAWAAQASAIERAFDEILSPIAKNWRDRAKVHEGFASLPITLSSDALRALYRAPDPRVAAITLNKVLATSALAESTAQINVSQVWSKYSTGAGQSIAILDTGVDAAHPFLRDNSTTPPTSKVWAEGCFGTSSPGPNPKYTSLCPLPWLPGTEDSVGPGTAAPYDPSIDANYLHGTHVAGIAAGDGGPGGMRGVAPGARIIAGKIFSRKYTSSTGVASDDVAAALAQIAALNDNRITVNLSIATGDGGLHAASAGACNNHNQLTTDRVASLVASGVPVVAATGNDSARGFIGWPSCVSNVIKVGAVFDDATAALWTGTNLPYPDDFVGPFFLAPGASIVSSIPGGTYQPISGTSMAAPHMSGLYALGKAVVPAWSVADLTAFFVANALVPGPTVTNMPNGPFSFQRVRLRDNL